MQLLTDICTVSSSNFTWSSFIGMLVVTAVMHIGRAEHGLFSRVEIQAAVNFMQDALAGVSRWCIDCRHTWEMVLKALSVSPFSNWSPLSRTKDSPSLASSDALC